MRRCVILLLLCAGCVSVQGPKYKGVPEFSAAGTADVVPVPTIGLAWDVMPDAIGSYNAAFEVDMSTNLGSWQALAYVTNDGGLPWESFRAPMIYPAEFFRLRVFMP